MKSTLKFFLSCIMPLALYLNSRSSRFPSMLPSRSFMGLCLTFISMAYFELIFVKEIMSVSRLIFFFFFACGCAVVPASFVEKTIFSLLYWLYSFAKGGSISGLTLYSVPLICLFFHQYHPVLMPEASELVLKLGSDSSPTLFFFNTMMGILGLLPLHINFRICLSISTK